MVLKVQRVGMRLSIGIIALIFLSGKVLLAQPVEVGV